MKKLLLLLLPLCGAFAQTKDIKPGVYQSNTMGTNFIMRLNEDKSYELVFLHGNYTQEGDTLKLNFDKKENSDFSVKPIAKEKNATSLTVTFKNLATRYLLSGVYLGTQHNDSRPPEYKNLREYFQMDELEAPEDQNEAVSFKIDKTKYLYLVNYRSYFSRRENKVTSISKFEIPDDVSEIEVEFDFNKMNELNFRLYKDEKDQVVMTEGKSPTPFIFTDVNQPAGSENKLMGQVFEDADFAKNAGLVADTDELLEQTIEEEVPSYTFKYTIDKTFSEAQKTAAKSKDKFLVVAFDYENKNGQADFDKFIKRTETQVGYNMSEEYVESEDHFSFYKASEKDKALLTKNKLDAKKPQILVFNSDGDLIYHTSSTLKQSGYFGNYNSAFNQLQQSSQYLKFDRSVTNKKATVPDLVKAFKLASKIEKPYQDIVVDSAAVSYDHDIEIEEPAAVEVTETTTVVDTAYADYGEFSREGVIIDKENLYKLKATSEMVKAKWAQVVAFYKKSSIYDQDYIDAGLNDLYREGFMSRLFTTDKNKIEAAVKFDFLDYVFTHLEEIKKAEIGFREQEDGAFHYDQNNVDSLLDSFFSEYGQRDNPQIDKLRQYYKRYIGMSGENASSVQSYFYFMQNTLSPETEREYLETYEKYFDLIIKPNSSVIENLDRVYSQSDNKVMNDDWAGFKYEFANTANTVAWYTVEHKLDTKDIEKAIRWSETSLKVDQNNAYFLDTLGQLYYLNGQKQKGIATEERAVSAAASMDDPDTKLKYEEVLESMKNGTY